MGPGVTGNGPVLAIESLTLASGDVVLVDAISLEVQAGEVVALVGESGCGKSLTALSILGLLPAAVRRCGGVIRLGDHELTAMSEAELQAIRGSLASLIFQEPVASLNPLMRVGDQVAEALQIHQGLRGDAARAAALQMLERVGIPEPAVRARQFPFELSGGMCQRIMIASALIGRPRLLIADEPTTALDVTIQAQILELMKSLRQEVGSAIVLITHDMGVVADMADRVAVMYGGCIVEQGRVEQVFSQPAHPYTRLLLETIPRLDGEPGRRLPTIEGTVPSADQWPVGCRFAPRCPDAFDRCAERPMLQSVEADRQQAACWSLSRRPIGVRISA